LDVVEEKITSTLDASARTRNFRTRFSAWEALQHLCTDPFQGGDGRHQAHYRAVKKQHEEVQQKIASTCAELKEDIEAEAISYGDIVLSHVKEWAALETSFDEDRPSILGKSSPHEDAVGDLEDSTRSPRRCRNSTGCDRRSP